jgi:hypothetical protein
MKPLNCWMDEQECTFSASASRPGLKPPAADPAQDLGPIRDKIAELRRRIDQLEARVAQQLSFDAGKHDAADVAGWDIDYMPGSVTG